MVYFEFFILLVAGFGLLFFTCALCDFLSFFEPSRNKSGTEVIGSTLVFGCLACLCWIYVYRSYTKLQETPETPATRDILLTVPEESSVNAQVTSDNNTVNIENL